LKVELWKISIQIQVPFHLCFFQFNFKPLGKNKFKASAKFQICFIFFILKPHSCILTWDTFNQGKSQVLFSFQIFQKSFCICKYNIYKAL